MKYITTMILAATFSLSFLSCQSVQQNKTVLAFAKAGNAYVQASPKIAARDKFIVDTAYNAVATGKLDKAQLLAIARDAALKHFGKNLSDTEKDAINAIVAQIETGQLDAKALMPLAKAAVITYAASQGVPPEQAAFLTSLAESFIA